MIFLPGLHGGAEGGSQNDKSVFVVEAGDCLRRARYRSVPRFAANDKTDLSVIPVEAGDSSLRSE